MDDKRKLLQEIIDSSSSSGIDKARAQYEISKLGEAEVEWSSKVIAKELLDLIGPLFMGVALVTPVVILGWQLVDYLQSGTWAAFSILSIMNFIGLNPEWVVQPQSWLGLHKVFDWLHGSVGISFLFLLASLIIIVENE
jgi:hypothetical protein